MQVSVETVAAGERKHGRLTLASTYRDPVRASAPSPYRGDLQARLKNEPVFFVGESPTRALPLALLAMGNDLSNIYASSLEGDDFRLSNTGTLFEDWYARIMRNNGLTSCGYDGAMKVRELRKHLTDAVALRLRLNYRVNARQLSSWFSSHPAIPTRNIYWQCPWTDYPTSINLGPLLVAFVRSAAQVQKAGDALLLGLTTLSTYRWREWYRLETVLVAAKECGYIIHTPDTAFIADALKHGYVHATEGPRKDIHHLLVHKLEVQVFIMGPPAHLARSPLPTPPPPPGAGRVAEQLPAKEERASDGRVSPSVDALAAALAGTHVDDRNVGDTGARPGARTKTPAQPLSDGSAARVDALFDRSQEAIRKLESSFRRRRNEPDGQAATAAQRPSDNDRLSTTLDAGHEMRVESMAPRPSDANAAKMDTILNRSEEALCIRTARLEARRESVPHGRGDSEPGGQAATVACPPDGRPNGQLSTTVSTSCEVHAESPAPPPSDTNAPGIEAVLSRSEEALHMRIARVEACRESVPRGRGDEPDGEAATVTCSPDSRPNGQLSMSVSAGHEVRAEASAPPPSKGDTARIDTILNRSEEALRIRVARVEARLGSVPRRRGDEPDGQATKAARPSDSRPDDQAPTTSGVGHEAPTESPAPPQSDSSAARLDVLLNRSEEAVRTRIARLEARRESAPHAHDDEPEGQAATAARPPDNRPNEHVSPTLGTLLVRAEALRLQTALLAASCRFSSATDPQFSSASHASRPIFALCPPSLPSNTASPRQSTASSLSTLLASAEALRVQTALLAARHDSSPTESVRLAPVSRESVTVSASSPLASAVVAAPSAFLERFDALLTSFTRAEYSSTPTGFNTNLSGATPGFVESPSSWPETTGEQRDTAQPSDAAPPCRVQ